MHPARTDRRSRRHGLRALAAAAAFLIGASALEAQETGTPDLRPAVSEQPATSPRVLTTQALSATPATPPAAPSAPAAATSATAEPAPPSEPAPTSSAPAAAPSPAPGAAADVAPSSATAPALASPATNAPVAADGTTAVPGAVPTAAGFAEPETAGTASLPHDLSPWGMFMAADMIVKGVMIGLAFASVVTWTIWLAKALELFAARMKAARALRCLERSTTLAEAVGAGRRWPKRGPVAALAQAALLERERSGGLEAEGVKDRAAVALHRIEARAGRSMARGTGLLATIGSTAPFVGLFGTVWGIMNSFIGISQANTTNLAVVAPGIAEALLATAIGLVAAIPAVIIYNVFARSIAGYRAVLADASAEVLRHLSRDLDRSGQRAEPKAALGALQAAE
ncbi:hypothetical protein ASG54_15635 [Aureimonas sp. Leaf460]|nr:hypothetical protein ASG62_00585 [Aureimonas sp. Leaf427]KQT76318.1 hypothetical protein ASG54_15635 [Aureimonas sp. Leaf460]